MERSLLRACGTGIGYTEIIMLLASSGFAAFVCGTKPWLWRCAHEDGVRFPVLLVWCVVWCGCFCVLHPTLGLGDSALCACIRMRCAHMWAGGDKPNANANDGGPVAAGVCSAVPTIQQGCCGLVALAVPVCECKLCLAGGSVAGGWRLARRRGVREANTRGKAG